MGRVGIDIGGSSVKAVRLDASSSIRTEHRAVYDTVAETPTSDEVVSAIKAAAAGVGLEAADNTGLCVPGLVDPSTGVLVNASNLPGLVGSDPGQLLRSVTGAAASRVLTDAAAWGFGVAAREPATARLLVIAIGTGIGAALLVNGEPRTLDGVTPGHIGMLDVSLGESAPPRAGDGTPGVLEAYAGGRALINRLGPSDLGASIRGLPENDPALRALTKALRICHAIYKPDAIRLVGGVGALYAPKLGEIDRQVRADLTSVARADWTLDVVDDPFLAAEGVARTLGVQGPGAGRG